MVSDRSRSRPTAISSSDKSSRNFALNDRAVGEDPTREHDKMIFPPHDSHGTTQENVISPSKMKKRISSGQQRLRSSKFDKPVSQIVRDSRDDAAINGRDHEQRFSKAATRKTANDSSHAQPIVATEQSDKNSRDSTSNLGGDDNSRVAEEDSPRTKMQKKLFDNLRDPDQSLKDLLTVLVDKNTSHLRRVNACGAIKTLTLNQSNQIPLARTKGVVSSITAVLCDVDATEEERTRCINALMHLCVPEQNWRLVYLFPQTAEALARNMADKYPQIRYAACLTLSFLAKKNRKELVKNKILMYSIARVLEVDRNGTLERISPQDKKVFVGSRLCALKMLLHLSKNRDISVKLASTDSVTSALVKIASTMELAANILCIAILTNLTRHPDNASCLVYNVPGLVTVLVSIAESTDQECSKCALYALQNLACTSNCRQELANTPDLLAVITKSAFKTQYPDQQLAALNTLKNLSDDPFNLVTMTNTPGCTATLLALANDPSNNMAQFLACDTLATLSHWLLTLSAAKRSKNKDGEPEMGRRTFQTSTWEMWN